MRDAELQSMRDGDFVYVIVYNGFCHTLIAGRYSNGFIITGPGGNERLSAHAAYKSLSEAIDAFKKQCPEEYKPTELRINLENPGDEDFKNLCTVYQKWLDLARRQLDDRYEDRLSRYKKVYDTVKSIEYGVREIAAKLNLKIAEELWQGKAARKKQKKEKKG